MQIEKLPRKIEDDGIMACMRKQPLLIKGENMRNDWLQA